MHATSAAVQLLAWMKANDVQALLVDDCNGNRPNYALGDYMDNEELSYLIGNAPTTVFRNSTPDSGWNPHVTVSALESYLDENKTFPAKLDARSIDELAELLPAPPLLDHEDWQADNTARALFAATALVSYAERVGDAGDLETSISDLLGDLRHLCDAIGSDFDALSMRGDGYHYAEIRGEV